MATYRLIRKLATGGMAEVFLAKGVGAGGFEKPVAVKRILPQLAEDRSFVELFLREAKLTVALQHANVVQVFDLGALGGRYYMVLEFVDGENLRALQREASARGVALGLREVCFIVQQVAEGLAYAHGRTGADGQPLHVIHRDVNPANVMVSTAGEVKLADFGIAKAANAQATTQAGVVKGKSGYLAPEQILRGEADQRSDLFLIGLLLYELLAGRRLFGDPDYFQALRAIAQFDVRTLPQLPGVPPALWRIVTRALAQDPTARFQRARELSDALRDFLFDHRLRVGPREMAELFARVFPSRRSPLELAVGEGGEEIRLAAGTPPHPPARAPAPQPPPLPRAVPAAAVPVPAAAPPPAARPVPVQVLARPTTPARPRGSAAHPRMGELLVARGKVTQAQLAGVLERQRRQGGRVGDMLVADGVVTEEDVVRVLSEQFGVPFIADEKLRTMPVPTALLAALPVEQAERFEAVPVVQTGRELVLAMREPRNLGRLDELKFRTGAPVRGIFATEGAIRHAIGRFYRGELPAPDWSSRVSVPGNEEEPGVIPYSDKHTGTRERLLDATAFEATPATAALPPPAPVLVPGDLLARTILVVADDVEQRDAAVRLLARQGVAAAASSGAEAVQAVALGGFELALLAANTLPDARALGAALRAAASGLDVRLLSSLGEALGGETGPLERSTQLQARVLDAALGMVGGAAEQGPALARLARGVARRLGAGQVEADRAAAVAYAVAFSARMEGSGRFARPASDTLRALLGADAAELAPLIAVCAPGAAPPTPAGRAAQGLAGALAFLESAGSVRPGPEPAAQALAALHSAGQLPASTMEALTAEVLEQVLGERPAHTVVLAEPHAARAAALQTRFLADGVRVRLAHSLAQVRTLLGEGAQALVLAAQLADGEGVALTRALRGEAARSGLPIFLLAPPEDRALLEAAFDAGVSDVLTHPVNPDVLAAKLRRALHPPTARPTP